MFDRVEYLKCAKNEFKEFFNNELNGECRDAFFDRESIRILVRYDNHDDWYKDINILGINLNSIINKENEEKIKDAHNFEIETSETNSFYITYELNDLKNFLNKKFYNAFTDDFDFFLDDSGDIAMFEVVKYDPIPYF